MSGSKHFDKIAWTVTALILAAVILFMNGTVLGLEVTAHTMGYENRLFDNTRVHSIDIVMDDWDEFITNAASEQYYAAAVVIDGEVYKNICKADLPGRLLMLGKCLKISTHLRFRVLSAVKCRKVLIPLKCKMVSAVCSPVGL